MPFYAVAVSQVGQAGFECHVGQGLCGRGLSVQWKKHHCKHEAALQAHAVLPPSDPLYSLHTATVSDLGQLQDMNPLGAGLQWGLNHIGRLEDSGNYSLPHLNSNSTWVVQSNRNSITWLGTNYNLCHHHLMLLHEAFSWTQQHVALYWLPEMCIARNYVFSSLLKDSCACLPTTCTLGLFFSLKYRICSPNNTIF